MFVRKKPNKSGVISIQIISKSGGSYELVRTVGSSSDPETIERLYFEAKREIDEMTGVLKLNFDKDREKELVEAHICIAFTACKIYKELERQLKEKKSELSPEKVIDILKTIYKITITTPYSKNRYARLLIKNDEQRELMELFNLNF